MPVGESTYPGTVDVPKNFGIARNNIGSSLALPCAIDDLEITVVDGSRFPASGFLTLDLLANRTPTSSEIVFFDGKVGNVLTLIDRGQDGTTAKAFAAGAIVEMNAVALHHNLVAETLCAIEERVDTVEDDLEVLELSLGDGIAAANIARIAGDAALQTQINDKQDEGNYITALTGDVTAGGPGSAAATIANGAVSFAKIQNFLDASTLFGRGAAGGAVGRAIVLGDNLSMVGNTIHAVGGSGGAATHAIVVTDAPYNAKGDGKELHNGATTVGSTTFTSATASFTAEDVGKLILIDGAGATGGFGSIGGVPAPAPIWASIATFVNSTTVTLSTPAGLTKTGCRFVYGTDDTAAIQAAFDAALQADQPSGSVVIFPPRTYFISSGLLIKRPAGADPVVAGVHYSGSILVSGYGARIMCGTPGPIKFMSLTPADFNCPFYYPVIEGFNYEGVAGFDQTAISLSHTFGAVIRDVRVRRIGVGIGMTLALQARISNVQVHYFSRYGCQFVGDSILQNNCTVIDGIECVPSSLALGGLFLGDVDQFDVLNAIFEATPGYPDYVADIIIDNTNTLGVYSHGIQVRNVYSEYTNSHTAMFKIINDGQVVLEGIRRNGAPGPAGVPMVDATGSTASSIICRDWTFTNSPPGSFSWILFKQNAANTVGWTFENMGEIARGVNTDLVTDAGLWVGGVIPSRITQIEPGRIASAP